MIIPKKIMAILCILLAASICEGTEREKRSPENRYARINALWKQRNHNKTSTNKIWREVKNDSVEPSKTEQNNEPPNELDERGLACLQNGNDEEGKTLLPEAVEQRHIEDMSKYDDISKHDKNFDETETCLKMAIEREGHNRDTLDEATTNIALLYKQQDKIQEGKDYLAALIRVGNRSAAMYLFTHFMEELKIEEAETLLLPLIQTDYLPALNSFGILCVMCHDLDKAEKYFILARDKGCRGSQQNLDSVNIMRNQPWLKPVVINPSPETKVEKEEIPSQSREETEKNTDNGESNEKSSEPEEASGKTSKKTLTQRKSIETMESPKKFPELAKDYSPEFNELLYQILCDKFRLENSKEQKTLSVILGYRKRAFEIEGYHIRRLFKKLFNNTEESEDSNAKKSKDSGQKDIRQNGSHKMLKNARLTLVPNADGHKKTAYSRQINKAKIKIVEGVVPKLTMADYNAVLKKK